MSIPSITTIETAKCLALLESALAPLVAAEIAHRLNLSGNRESQRRHIRAIIEYLRDNGSQIIATLQQGYWLTEDAGLWRDYLEGRQIDAKRILGETHRRKKMLADSQGQGHLFEQKIFAGCATINTVN